MLTALVMLAVAYLLIYVEFYLPGGVVGTAGAIIYIVSIVFFAQAADSFALMLAYVALSGTGLVLLFRMALHRIKSAPPGSSVYSEGDQEGYRGSSYDESLLGREGVAHTDLRRSGYVKIDGKRFQAISRMGYVEKGTQIKVIGGEGAHLLVKILEDESS